MSESLFDTNLESKITLEREFAALPEDQPFRILMIGDWAGKSAFAAKNLSERRPIEIDRDEFDTVIRKISPEVELKFEGNESNSLKIKFETLDDFHPDNIFQQLPLFADLRELRRKLKNPETFNEVAREVRSWYSDSASDSDSSNFSNESSTMTSNSLDEGSLLDQILEGKSETVTLKKSSPKTELSEFIGNIVAPHIIKTDLEEQSKLLIIIDEVISDLMRKILHHEDFQRLESAWRGLYFTTKRVETDNKLKIFLLQLSKQELSDNLSSVSNLEDSEFYRFLVCDSSLTGEQKPWAAVCGNYSFLPTVDDTAALIRIAKIAKEANSPFISYIKPTIWGKEAYQDFSDQRSWKISEDSSEFQLWSALRSIPESSYLGLAIPRFLGRLPYGENTEPTEVFAFEEFIGFADHNNYLWFNPCFAYAYKLAHEYKINEWNFDLDKSFDLENIPLHIYQYEGETITKNCAEIEATETGYNAIREQGLMSLISFRDSDKVRLSALRSVSEKNPLLSGKWSD